MSPRAGLSPKPPGTMSAGRWLLKRFRLGLLLWRKPEKLTIRVTWIKYVARHKKQRAFAGIKKLKM
jgi:hypothetical protein